MSKHRATALDIENFNKRIVMRCTTPLSAPQIAKSLDLKLPTVYKCVDRLTESGYLKLEKNDDGKKFYTALKSYVLQKTQPQISDLIMKSLISGDKTVRDICKELNATRTYVSNLITRLCTTNKVETYLKFDSEMGRNVSYYTLRKLTNKSKVYMFSEDKGLQKLQKETDALTRSMRKSSKTHVGISTIYNG